MGIHAGVCPARQRHYLRVASTHIAARKRSPVKPIRAMEPSQEQADTAQRFLVQQLEPVASRPDVKLILVQMEEGTTENNLLALGRDDGKVFDVWAATGQDLLYKLLKKFGPKKVQQVQQVYRPLWERDMLDRSELAGQTPDHLAPFMKRVCGYEPDTKLIVYAFDTTPPPMDDPHTVPPGVWLVLDETQLGEVDNDVLAQRIKTAVTHSVCWRIDIIPATTTTTTTTV